MPHGAGAGAAGAPGAAGAAVGAAAGAAGAAGGAAAAGAAAAAASSSGGSSSSSNFLIYEIEVAVDAAPAIFGRYLVTLCRQQLVAADAFRAEHWVQSRR